MNFGIIYATLAFIAMNYVYCWITGKDIWVAHERSFFQCVLGLYLSINY